MSDKTESYMTTNSAIVFSIDHPKVEDIEVEDIAHALSLICRYNGQIREFYSVAQHSILVASMVPSKYAMFALMHDASEAYIGDVITPLKKVLKETYLDIEDKFMRAVAKKFHFSMNKKARVAVKEADMILLRTEMRDLSNFDFLEGKRLAQRITPWVPKTAETAFLAFYKLILSEQ